MWDLIALIDYQFDTWKETLWAKIKTDDLLQLVEKMRTGQCNPQAAGNKEIKTWKSFTALTDRVKNMNTVLPLVSLLNSKDILDRHWKKLMVTCNQTIDFKSPKFSLQDLITLELHRFSEEV
jgi:dynein heavy chain